MQVSLRVLFFIINLLLKGFFPWLTLKSEEKNFRLGFYGDENDRYIASRVGLKLSSLKIVR